MVGGVRIAVTAVPRVHQWAETLRTVFGRPIVRAMDAQVRVASLSSMALTGLPCPKNTTGILVPSDTRTAMVCAHALPAILVARHEPAVELLLRSLLPRVAAARRKSGTQADLHQLIDVLVLRHDL